MPKNGGHFKLSQPKWFVETQNHGPASIGVHRPKSQRQFYIRDPGTNDFQLIEKAKSHLIVEIIEHLPNSVVSKTIIKKLISVSVMSFDTGEGLSEKTSPFYAFVQIIEGKANIVINKVSRIPRSQRGE